MKYEPFQTICRYTNIQFKITIFTIEVKNLKMKILLKFALISFLLTSCDLINDSSNLQLGEINYEELSEETQSQIVGPGCGFSTEKDGNPIFVNGLMKINGVYELMNYVETNDSKTLLYVNKNWEFQLNVEKEIEQATGSIMEGTATLKSRTSDEVKTFDAFGGCGS